MNDLMDLIINILCFIYPNLANTRSEIVVQYLLGVWDVIRWLKSQPRKYTFLVLKIWQFTVRRLSCYTHSELDDAQYARFLA